MRSSPAPLARAVSTPLAALPAALAALGAALAALGAALGCATVAPAAQKVQVPELHVVARPTGVGVGKDALEVYDAKTLFDRGLDLMQGQAWADAALYFERLVKEFPDDPHALLADYNRGVCYIHTERGDEAVTAFDRYLAGLPSTATDKDRLDGRFKRGQALAVAKRYEEVVELFDTMLGEELVVEDRIEALVDAGVGHYMLGLPDPEGFHRPTAESRFLEARRLYKTASETARLDVSFFVAQAAFYLAELARLEFSEYKMHFPTVDDLKKAQADTRNPRAADKTLESLLGEQLEEKCQRLLRAQYGYLRTIREQHPGWASAAGYNVGQMYEELHDELINLPAPDDLSPEAKELYNKMVRKKVLILLEKAEKTWSQTADMVTRTGADSEWSTKTRASLERIKQKILAEAAASADVDDPGAAAVAGAAPGKENG